jgi:hypothetical protein
VSFAASSLQGGLWAQIERPSPVVSEDRFLEIVTNLDRRHALRRRTCAPELSVYGSVTVAEAFPRGI